MVVYRSVLVVVVGRFEQLFIETLTFISRILICTVVAGNIAILLFNCVIPCKETDF